MFYAISYDIRDDRRRLRVAKLLTNFGERVQYSVFEANLEPGEWERLRAGLESLVDPEEDSVRMYPLCGVCVGRVEIMGPGEITQDPEMIII
jgi:CRISPR-associated protein Cas2